MRYYLLSLIVSTQLFAISDREIVTSDDLKYCPPNTLKTILKPVDPRTLPDDGTVYRVGSNRWNEQWEQKYSKWVVSEVTPDFMKTYDLETDCADAALVIRAVFARIHHLPMSFNGAIADQSTKNVKDLPTVKVWNESNWKTSLKSDKRFRAALDGWRKDLGTCNLKDFTHPVKIVDTKNKKLSKFVRPGCPVFSGGHTRFICSIDPKSSYPVNQLESTVPAGVRTLSRSTYDVNPGDIDQGILAWNWSYNCGKGFKLVRDKDMSSYGEDHTEMKFKNLCSQMEIPIPESFTELVEYLGSDDKNKTNLSRCADARKKKAAYTDLLNALIISFKQADELKRQNPKVFEDPSTLIYDQYSSGHRNERLIALKGEYQKLDEKSDCGTDYSDYSNVEQEIFSKVFAHEVKADPNLFLEERLGIKDDIQFYVETNKKTASFYTEKEAIRMAKLGRDDFKNYLKRASLNEDDIYKFNCAKIDCINDLRKYLKEIGLPNAEGAANNIIMYSKFADDDVQVQLYKGMFDSYKKRLVELEKAFPNVVKPTDVDIKF